MTIRRKNDNEKTGMGFQNNPNHKLEAIQIMKIRHTLISSLP